MGLIFRAERGEGQKGMSLSELRDFVNRAVAHAGPEDDLTQVFPTVATTIGGKPLIKKMELTLP